MAVYNFGLEVITPVHIGMGSEKSYIKGLDYVYQNGGYIIYSQDKLLNSLEKRDVNAVSSFLSSGDFSRFNEYVTNKHLLNDEMVLYKWQSEYHAQNDIRRNIQDGLGHWIIPGSSIKGAIRGIILTHLYNASGRRGKPDEANLLGEINNNLMRFVQISDCILNTTPGIYPVKIFSADPENEGQWKHKRKGGHEANFKSTGFVTFYEMLTDGVNTNSTLGDFKFNWGIPRIIYSKRKDDIPNIQTLFNQDGKGDIKLLIKIIKNHTDKYLEKEIEFFKNYANEALSDESFFDELQWIKEQNKKDDESCYFRIGANEGWHSITGDWRWNNFIDATERNRNNFNGRIQKAYKTRKLIFDWDYKGENDEVGHQRFVLPGFVKITLSNDQ